MNNKEIRNKIDDVTMNVYSIKDVLIMLNEVMANIKQDTNNNTAYEFDRLVDTLDSVLNDCISRLSGLGDATADIGMKLYQPSEV